MYPASTFKAFIAAAILSDKNVELTARYTVAPGLKNKDLYPIVSKTMGEGWTKSVSELLSLMLFQSDNRAANTLYKLTDVDGFLLRHGFRRQDELGNFCGTGTTMKFLNAKKDNTADKVLFRDRVVTSAGDLARFASMVETGGFGDNSDDIRKVLINNSQKVMFEDIIWRKGGNLNFKPKKFNIKFPAYYSGLWQNYLCKPR